MNNNDTEELENFDEYLGEYHNGKLVKGIYEYGFERPSQIQSKTIPMICSGVDLIAQAQSGSGKTGAFVISALTKIDEELECPQIMVVVNTHELATQVLDVTHHLAKHLRIKTCLCIGGKVINDRGESKNNVMTNFNEASNSHFLVVTPGRINDLIRRGLDQQKNLLKHIKLVILDEADKLLTTFTGDMETFSRSLPKNAQVCMFSATYCEEALIIAKKIVNVNNFKEILISPENVGVDMIKNYFVIVDNDDDKYAMLIQIYKKVTVCQAVIFVNSIKRADNLAARLEADGHCVGIIHSAFDDKTRRDRLREFRTRTRILVATDIVARGIDVQQVGLVINYDVPDDPEQYIHRVGRSGRFGKSGVAITFVRDDSRFKKMPSRTKSDPIKMDDIERSYKINFLSLPNLDKLGEQLTSK